MARSTNVERRDEKRQEAALGPEIVTEVLRPRAKMCRRCGKRMLVGRW